MSGQQEMPGKARERIPLPSQEWGNPEKPASAQPTVHSREAEAQTGLRTRRPPSSGSEPRTWPPETTQRWVRAKHVAPETTQRWVRAEEAVGRGSRTLFACPHPWLPAPSSLPSQAA